MPVAQPVASPVAPSAVYGMGRVDASGRVAERAVIGALGWQPGDRLAMSLIHGSVLVRPDAAGVFVLSGRPYVVLPAAVRLRCGVRVGDQVLLAARPDRGVLLVHPLAVLEAMLAEHHAALLGGERP